MHYIVLLNLHNSSPDLQIVREVGAYQTRGLVRNSSLNIIILKTLITKKNKTILKTLLKIFLHR